MVDLSFHIELPFFSPGSFGTVCKKAWPFSINFSRIHVVHAVCQGSAFLPCNSIPVTTPAMMVNLHCLSFFLSINFTFRKSFSPDPSRPFQTFLFLSACSLVFLSLASPFSSSFPASYPL